MQIRTRFAPSPTGLLHLGNVRTALFNWLYARHWGGEFLLRIEDTDEARSTVEFQNSILEALQWLGLNWDGDIHIQSTRKERHQAVAYELLEQGEAYRCYCSPQELEAMRNEAAQKGLPPLYNRKWRDYKGPNLDQPFVIRLKVPTEGDTSFDDMVQGSMRVACNTLDDMVLLRSDGSPTYMLAVVVDDHDMGITHIIRGDDHLTNAFRQIQLYQALRWHIPIMGHIPLIHASSGEKLSKRHQASGMDFYQEQGILPEALFNALLRLGWSHGNDEKISRAQAIEWFDGSHLSRSAARFDENKVLALNGYYMRQRTPQSLWELIQKDMPPESDTEKALQAIPDLVQRCKTVKDLRHMLLPYILPQLAKQPPLEPAERALIANFIPYLSDITWEEDALNECIQGFLQDHAIGMATLARPLRLALTGSVVSPHLTSVLLTLGSQWSVERLSASLES